MSCFALSPLIRRIARVTRTGVCGCLLLLGVVPGTERHRKRRGLRVVLLTGLLVLIEGAGGLPLAHAGGVVSVCDKAHLDAALSGGGIVTFSCSGTIVDNITLSVNTTLDGSGQQVTLDGAGSDVVHVTNAAHVTLNTLTLAHGAYNGGGALTTDAGTVVTFTNSLMHGSGNNDAGIINGGTMTVSNSTISGNSGLSNFGPLFNGGTMTVSNSTISGNTAAGGGGVYNYGTVTLLNSTISGNTATESAGGGGGIDNNGGTVTLLNSTISGNTADVLGGGVFNNGTLLLINSTVSGNTAGHKGGGLYNSTGTTTLRATIVAGNSASLGGPDIENAIHSSGYNLIGNTSDTRGFVATDLQNVNPELGPLQDNGGPTFTMADDAQTSQPAVDYVPAAHCLDQNGHPLSTDQRGFPRPDETADNGACDIGAYEAQASTAGPWTPTGALPVGRSAPIATRLADGQVLVAGGCCDSQDASLASANLYTPSTGKWSATGTMHTPRFRARAVLLNSGQVLVTGGCGCISAELYTPSTGIWTQTGNLHVRRTEDTETLLANGHVLVTGGCGVNCTSTELYNPSTGVWSLTSNMHIPRDAAGDALLSTGQVLITGGISCTTSGCMRVASADLYTPSTGVWTITGALHAARAYHTERLLTNGQILVEGGENGHAALASAELYTPSTGVWTLTGALHTARFGQTATPLANGQVLVSGGYATYGSTTALASAELYDPSTGVWTLTGAMHTARAEQKATRLLTGQVLVTGGVNSSGGSLASAELYTAPSGSADASATLPSGD